MGKVEEAREYYQPTSVIKYLLVAEAPPASFERFFYYENVQKYDGLFLETMKVLYLTEDCDPKFVRKNKKRLLEKFKEDGFFLIDAAPEPMPKGSNGRQKEAKLKASIEYLVDAMKWLEHKGLISSYTPVILIATPVYNACKGRLLEEGFNVVNTNPVPSASFGKQKIFRKELESIRNELQIKPIDILACA